MRTGYKSIMGNKVIAVIMIALMLFVVALSALYVIVESCHNCNDNHCPICAYIHQFKTATKFFIIGLMGTATVFSFVRIRCVIFDSVSKSLSKGTLIKEKIRINC